MKIQVVGLTPDMLLIMHSILEDIKKGGINKAELDMVTVNLPYNKDEVF